MFGIRRENMETEEISSKVFAVYRDHFLRDVTAKNRELEAVNESMEPAKKLLTTVCFYRSSVELNDNSLWKEFNLLDNHEDTDTHLVYHEEQPDRIIPIEQLTKLRVKISGYKVRIGRSDISLLFDLIKNHPCITVNHEIGTVVMEFNCCRSICIVGEINNLSGSLEELQNMIDSRSILRFFTKFLPRPNIPMVGLPREPFTHDTCLDGSIFVLRSIKILKKSVDDIMIYEPNDMDDYYKTETVLQNLELISKIEDSKCQDVEVAALKRKELLIHNACLSSARDKLKKLVLVSFRKYGNETYGIELRLSTDWYGDNSVFDNQPVMNFEVPKEEGSHVPIYVLTRFYFKLGQYQEEGPGRSFEFDEFVQAEDGVWFPCGRYISVFFAFDESADEIDFASRGVTRLRYLFFRMDLETQRRDTSQEPHFTMRLKYVAIHLCLIEEQLNALGVDTATSVL